MEVGGLTEIPMLGASRYEDELGRSDGTIAINPPIPPREMSIFPPYEFFGATLDTVGKMKKMTLHPDIPYNATISFSRRLNLPPDMRDVGSAYVPGSIAFHHTDYLTMGLGLDLPPSEPYGFSADPPFCGSELTLPMTNCSLLALADTISSNALRKRNGGADPNDEYTEELVTRLYRRDGVFQTLEQADIDAAPPGSFDGHKPDAAATIVARNRMDIRTIWGEGLKQGMALYLMLKKFPPSQLLNLPYCIKPASGKVNEYRRTLERLCGGMRDGACGRMREEQWVYQFVPVKPYDCSSSSNSLDNFLDSTLYEDERGHMRVAKLFKIAIVEYTMQGHMVDFDPMPAACFNTAALLAVNSVGSVVDCCYDGIGG